MSRPRSASMSWAEMEKELRVSHDVSPVVLRGIKIVSDLQALLEKHRRMRSGDAGDDRPPLCGVPATGVTLKDEPAVLPHHHQRPRLLSIESESTDVGSSGADSDAPNSSDESELFSIAASMCTLPKNVTKTVTQPIVENSSNRALSTPKKTHAAQALLGLTGPKPSIKIEDIPAKKRLIAELSDSEEKAKKERIGAYTPRSRKELLQKFHDKRKKRIWRKKVRYDCRKSFANNRVRVKGRFVKKDEQLDKGEQWHSYLLKKETAAKGLEEPEASKMEVAMGS